MAISPKLGTRQTQQLTMTPELQQSIAMLQMNALDLQTFVNSEIESNPLLEHGQSEEITETEASDPEDQQSLDVQFAKADLVSTRAAFDGGAENMPGVFSDHISPLRGQGISPETWIGNPAENIARERSLADSLRDQISMMVLSPSIRSVALALIGELDEDGYLRADPGEIATRLGVCPDDISDAKKIIQSCEPVGVGAATLAECLEAQLAESGELTETMATVLGHLDFLAARGSEAFSRKLGIRPPMLAEILKKLRSLNAYPGLISEHVVTDYAVPEVIVLRNNLGGWSVELNTDALPKVLMNNQYSALVDNLTGSHAQFISNCTSRAKWVIRSLDQRARTILKVAAEIVRLQDHFFTHGISELRPLTLRELAENIDVHESTVSRVTNGKYLQCERGIFELKFFFSSAISGAVGTDSHSARSIQAKIRSLINSEDPRKTLSDDAIVKLLQNEGIIVARRTVSKYREGMRIPSSVMRRRQKATPSKGQA